MSDAPQGGSEGVLPEGASPKLDESQSGPSRRQTPPARAWFRLVPFFFSALLFFTGIFSLFSPLPLLLVGISKGPAYALAAGLVNSAFVYVLGGKTLFLFFLVTVVWVGAVMPIFLKKKKMGLERTLGWTWVTEIAIVLAMITFYAISNRLPPLTQVQAVLSEFFDWLIASIKPENRGQLFGELTLEDWKAQSMVELPMSLLTVSLISIWVNLNVLVAMMGRANRAEMGLDRKSFFRWKNPEWLIWPLILVWTGFLFLEGAQGQIAQGLFKVFLAIYAIQGVAILGSVFDAWKVRGLFRLVLYFFALFLVLPLVIAIGFFDQWFDFRSKIRQS